MKAPAKPISVPEDYRAKRRIILVSMILITLVPFALILFIGYSALTASLQRGAVESLQRIVEDHREIIENFLKERRKDLEFIGDAYPYAFLSRTENLQSVFSHLQKHSQAFIDMSVVDENGLHVAYVGTYSLIGKSYAEADWFKEVMKRGYFMSDIFLGYRQVPHFVMAVTRTENGRAWVIRATFDSYRFNELVEKVHIGNTGEAYILNAQGLLQTSRRSGGSLLDIPGDVIHFPETAGSVITFIESDKKGKDFLYATTWLHDKKWLLVVRQDKSDAFSALHKAVSLTLLVSLVGGAVIIASAVYLSDRIVLRLETRDREKAQLEQHLIRAGRLAELGEMAAGLAHEINNPLQIIRNEQALMAIAVDDLKAADADPTAALTDLKDSLDQVQLQIGRCAIITQSFLNFGRQSEPVFQAVSLMDFVPDIIGMVRQKAVINGIELTQDIPAGIPDVHGDISQLQQVFLNLFNNGIDAIVEKHGTSGGHLAVTAWNGDDNYVEVRIADNGSGIEPEIIDKIFSPFFTTKPVGRGTGLGLSVCYGIINTMGGKITAETTRDSGTTFVLKLPVHEDSRPATGTGISGRKAPPGKPDDDSFN
ncbi:MAG: ATP-binding protein [Desulfobacterales bacterium]